jgi:hypothetical protein
MIETTRITIMMLILRRNEYVPVELSKRDGMGVWT